MKLTFLIKELILVVQIKVVQFAPIHAKIVQVILQHAQNAIQQSVLLVEVVCKQHVPVMMVIMMQDLIKIVHPKVVKSVLILAINVKERPLRVQNVMML